MFVGVTRRLIKNPRLFMGFLFNFWPPVLGAGIRVLRVTPDLKLLKVGLPLRFYNRTGVGTHFGGSLYAMTDPFYMIMLIHQIGDGHVVWDKGARIDFVKPGKGLVTAQFELTDDIINGIVEKAKSGEPIIETFHVSVVDGDQNVVANVEKKVYIKKKTKRM